MSRNCFSGRMNITPENGYFKEYTFVYSYVHDLANDPNNIRRTSYYKKINIDDNSYIEIERSIEKNYDFFTYHKNNIIIQFKNFNSNSVIIEVNEVVNDGKDDIHFFPCIPNDSFIRDIFYKVMEEVSRIFESEIEDYKEKDEDIRNRIINEMLRS